MKTRSVVASLLFNEAGEVLLQQRDDKPGLVFAGFWTLFGGQVEAGEAPEAAIRRELDEEIGYVPPLDFWLSYVCPVRSIPGDVMTTNHVFTGQMGVPIETLTLMEGQAMRYFHLDAAAAMSIAFRQEAVLRAYMDGKAVVEWE
jgi:8-oxo-dGTP diphosphatase